MKKQVACLFSFIALVAMLISMSPLHQAQAAPTAPTRQDFIRSQVIADNAFISDPTIKKAKYTEMADTLSNYFRATNTIYYQDLQNGTIRIPSSWKKEDNLNTWLSGDFHSQNIGSINDKNGNAVFDLNDFDDANIGPFYWDLVRFSTSLQLLTRDSNIPYTASQRQSLIQSFLQSYQNTLQNVDGNTNETRLSMNSASIAPGFVSTELQDQADKKQSDLLNKWTKSNKNQRAFNLKNKDLQPVDAITRLALRSNWSNYPHTLAPEFVAAQKSTYFNIKDIVRRTNSGLGSLGVDKYYVLIEGASNSQNDDRILEVKEQPTPNTPNPTPNAPFANNAQRVITANKALAINEDNHLGYLPLGGKWFSVKNISPAKHEFDDTDFKTQADLSDFALNAGRALALAHARSDKDFSRDYIQYNIEHSALHTMLTQPNFQSTIYTLSAKYADQVRTDYTTFTKLLKAGALN